MENKELKRISIEDSIVEIRYEDEKVGIRFGNKEIEFYGHHDQSCCESVYADFSQIKNYIDDINQKKFKEIVIKGVEGMGFLMCFYADWEESVKVFIPCYNCQNGYYSSNLVLVLNTTENNSVSSEKIDISDLVEDHIK
jgi:hypothetical protein